jgi:Na+-translocating ferredoxin:NAD+ oxidoreductase RNF subunit RnfB
VCILVIVAPDRVCTSAKVRRLMLSTLECAGRMTGMNVYISACSTDCFIISCRVEMIQKLKWKPNANQQAMSQRGEDPERT